MKFFTVLFWSMILGQILGYILSALQGTPDNYFIAAGISIYMAVFVYFLGNVIKPKAEAK
ncbi:YjzD family protein [Floricoccus penangensis]|uniref:DUF2929 domain-containing protein n=1 Tax=Floricoccus penangensis TaxID=1859475 RepID=A0A9Q5JGS6_9LACT|nr:YjzD family protein [Floricoccus penangensis]OFI46825.1 hypothetical protein BG262_03255 [Floricoccus penangensis]URZ86673.1 DUF2929 family protein [Floricoccus penangensis]